MLSSTFPYEWPVSNACCGNPDSCLISLIQLDLRIFYHCLNIFVQKSRYFCINPCVICFLLIPFTCNFYIAFIGKLRKAFHLFFVTYLTKLSVSTLYNFAWEEKKWIGKRFGRNRSWPDRGTIPVFAWRDWRKTRKISDRTIFAPAEIRTTPEYSSPTSPLDYPLHSFTFIFCKVRRVVFDFSSLISSSCLDVPLFWFCSVIVW
jgi:hypothetical protein